MKSFYNTEYLALQLLTSDIKHLPNEDAIRYKTKPKPEIMLDIGGYFSYPNTYGMSVMDESSYFVQVKDNKDFNEVRYNLSSVIKSKSKLIKVFECKAYFQRDSGLS